MQTVLAVTAIDRLCDSLISERTGRFCHKLFQVCVAHLHAAKSPAPQDLVLAPARMIWSEYEAVSWYRA